MLLAFEFDQDIVKQSPQALIEALSQSYLDISLDRHNVLLTAAEKGVKFATKRLARFAWLLDSILSKADWLVNLLQDTPSELRRWHNIFAYRVKKSTKQDILGYLQESDLVAVHNRL